MVRSSSLSLTTLGLSSALCLMSAMSPSFAAKPEQLKNRAMGTKVDCRGAHSCASWLTTNFAGKRPLAILANDRWIVSIAPLARSLPEQGPGGEDPGNDGTEPPGTGGDIPTEDGGAAADDNNGHGNDPGHVDDSNPGNSSDNQNGGADNNGSDNGNAGGSNNNGSGNGNAGGSDNDG